MVHALICNVLKSQKKRYYPTIRHMNQQNNTIILMLRFYTLFCLTFLLVPASAAREMPPPAPNEASYTKEPAKQPSRLAYKIAKWQLKRLMKQAVRETPMFSAAIRRDSGCLWLFLRSGEKIAVQNVHILQGNVSYLPCGTYKEQPKSVFLNKINRIETQKGDVIFSKKEYRPGVIEAAERMPLDDTACLKLILKNGNMIPVRRYSLADREIIISPCNLPDNTEIVLSEWYVHSIQRHTGRIEYRNNSNRKVPSSLAYRTDPLAIAAFLCSIFPIFSIFSLIAAIVLGIISLIRIRNNPEQFKGRGLAIAAIVISFSWVLLLLLLLAALF
jgi:hypothetical protein